MKKEIKIKKTVIQETIFLGWKLHLSTNNRYFIEKIETKEFVKIPAKEVRYFENFINFNWLENCFNSYK